MNMSEEETLAPSPRDRARPRIIQTRQSLGAVGRVASRVKSSGMSMMPTSILGWGKEDEDNVNVSPWAAEKSALAPMSQSEPDHEPLKKKSTRSPRTRESEVFASPVSNNSRQGTLEDVSRSIQRRKTGNFSGFARKTDNGFGNATEPNGRRILKSASNLAPRHSSTQGDDKTDTLSTLDLKKNKQVAANFNPALLMKGVSKLILRSGGGDAEGKTKISSEVGLKSSSVPGTSPISDDVDNDIENQRNLKTRRVSRGFGLHKQKTQEDVEGNKNKIVSTPAKESGNAQSRNKVAVEITRGLAKSISSAARAPLDLVSDKSTSADHQARGSKHHNGKHQVQFSVSGRDKEARPTKPRNSWFGFGREEKSIEEPKKRGTSRVRMKSKLRAQSSPSQTTTPGEVKKKNPRGLDKVVDFAVDEYFDSEEDEIEAGGNVRSLAEDDFISYQTRHMRKGDRGRNR